MCTKNHPLLLFTESFKPWPVRSSERWYPDRVCCWGDRQTSRWKRRQWVSELCRQLFKTPGHLSPHHLNRSSEDPYPVCLSEETAHVKTVSCILTMCCITPWPWDMEACGLGWLLHDEWKVVTPYFASVALICSTEKKLQCTWEQ